jgi:PPOX class probable F420-dependent enzyme
VCFALDRDRIVSAVDHKPKSTRALARLADIRRTARATLLVDHYDDTRWSALWWVRVTGPATVLEPDDHEAAAAVRVLIGKYPQYEAEPPRGPVSTIFVERLTWWRASDPGAAP